MASSTHNNLDQFVSDFLSYHQSSGEDLSIPFDSQWPSTCYTSIVGDGEYVTWRPQFQGAKNTFSNVEKALGISLNNDFCQFFTRYYSENLDAMAEQGPCQLLQVWNDDDFERLQQNIIGHVLMKQRLKQAPTLFFALTDNDDFILSVLNDTGEVVLEQVGLPPREVISPSLGDFIAALSPC